MGEILKFKQPRKNKVLNINSIDLVPDYIKNDIIIIIKCYGFELQVALWGTLLFITTSKDIEITNSYILNEYSLQLEYIKIIQELYIEFGFIDSITLLSNPISTILELYLKKRKEIGYPYNQKEFELIQKIEREIFSSFTSDVSSIKADLWWRSNKY